MIENITITPLFSGSTGNSILIEGGDTKILIDAGVSTQRICSALIKAGTDISHIDAILITHEHADHIHALPILEKKYRTPVYMTAPSFHASGLSCEAELIEPCAHICIKDLVITSFPLSHDTACCVGYTVQYGDGKVGVMTDTGYITDEAVAAMVGCGTVLIESNHDIAMLKSGRYPYYLKQRILSRRGHLSNADCASFCSFLRGHGTRRFILAHLSKENNEPGKALACARAALGDDAECVCAPETII